MFCPSHFTVSPSTTVSDAQMMSPAIIYFPLLLIKNPP
jgi:hypothetical protein